MRQQGLKFECYCLLAFEFVICVTVHTFVFTWSRRKHETQDKNKMLKHASNAGKRLENGDIDGVGFRGKVENGRNKCPN